jgi:exodeoxyribonuclease VII large subunit
MAKGVNVEIRFDDEDDDDVDGDSGDARPGAGSEDRRPRPLTISQLTALLKGVVEESFPTLWVEGEISNLTRPRSGHLYMTLKDAGAQIRAVIWAGTASRLPFKLEEGQAVIAQGGVEVYPPHGSYQLIIRRIEPQGIGALQLAFEQLKRKLAAEGLFDADRKLQLPRYPKRIGIVTSPSGAAIRDFLQIALRRWPQLDALVIPAKVQGAGAAQSIAAAIAAAQAVRPALDVIVVTRGGGSLEDLWCFNEEPVVRAIAACKIPVVSAVGHEIDVTLADFAADVRAATPSEAAERVVPERAMVLQSLKQLRTRLDKPIAQRLAFHREQLRQLAGRPCLAKPLQPIHDRSRRLDELDYRGRLAIRNLLDQHFRKLQRQAAALSALSPLAVLARGYSVTQTFPDGAVVRRNDDVAVGDRIQTRLGSGSLISRVEESRPEPG